MIKKAAALTTVLFATLALVACGEPDWEGMTVDHWSSQEAAKYYSIVRVQECDPRIDGDARQVHCRLEVRMDAALNDAVQERGSVTEDTVVAELTHRFGRFEKGDERIVAVITRFEPDGRGWKVVPR